MKRFWDLPYPSRREPVVAENLVASSQPLAAQAGLAMLQRGGNAIDAAVATAIALTVLEPTSNGIGGDAFAQIVESDGTMHALNASGRSPRAWSPERFAGCDRMPDQGWESVTVPGAVSAWVALSQRFGSLPLSELAAPAIRYAERGFPVGPVTARAWGRSVDRHGKRADFAEAFTIAGRAPWPGERFRCPAQARTLAAIAESGGAAFYRGALAEAMVAHAERDGGALSLADLAEHEPEWTTAIDTRYGDWTLHELPPNGQGIAALIAAGICVELPLADCAPESADALHWQAEAMKLAFADLHAHVADPARMHVDPARLYAPDYCRERAKLIDPRKAGAPASGIPRHGGTVYLCAADGAGRMVSYIQSNYQGFGSGVVVPDTGIAMQNRGHGFTLEDGHGNQVDGRKRPLHTIIPGMLSRHREACCAFGVMGGPMQAQGHLQMLLRLAGWGQNPQAACDAPRWQVDADGSLLLEAGFDDAVAEELAARGHRVAREAPERFGGAQLIMRLGDGVHLGASDWRKEGQAVGC